MKRREKWEAQQRATVPVLMQFRYEHTAKLWRVTFRLRAESLALPRVIHFGDSEKIRDLFRRFGSRQMSEDHSALEFAIQTKRGAVELLLGREQVSKLETPKPPTLKTDQ